jgi:hypothetical protein
MLITAIIIIAFFSCREQKPKGPTVDNPIKWAGKSTAEGTEHAKGWAGKTGGKPIVSERRTGTVRVYVIVSAQNQRSTKLI